jgi:hypothetical protein
MPRDHGRELIQTYTQTIHPPQSQSATFDSKPGVSLPQLTQNHPSLELRFDVSEIRNIDCQFRIMGMIEASL